MRVARPRREGAHAAPNPLLRVALDERAMPGREAVESMALEGMATASWLTREGEEEGTGFLLCFWLPRGLYTRDNCLAPSPQLSLPTGVRNVEGASSEVREKLHTYMAVVGARKTSSLAPSPTCTGDQQ